MKLTFLLALTILTAAPLSAQTSAQQRYAADFSKKKDQTKTKRGVTIRKFHDVRSVPWTALSIKSYAGHYQSDLMQLDIGISASGMVSARGHDGAGAFELNHAEIKNGMLRGTKIYNDGKRESFEAAFLERYDVVAPGAAATHSYGLGSYVPAAEAPGGVENLRLFLMKEGTD